ncbi:MAG: TVP38/TMEM64 family protein [Clostridia bacterium]
MKRKIKLEKKKVIKIGTTVGLVALWIVAAIFLYPIIQNLKTPEGQQTFQNIVKDSGILGFGILFLLEIAQIFFVVLPAEPLEVLAGMCYGSMGGCVFILTCVCITTAVIYGITRKYGKRLITFFFGKERVEKIENSKLYQNEKIVEKILIVLFFITGTPKDLLVYIGAILPIKPIRFIIISTFARIPSVISSTIAGEHLSVGNWEVSILVYGITFLITVVIMGIIHYFDKEHIARRAIQELK